MATLTRSVILQGASRLQAQLKAVLREKVGRKFAPRVSVGYTAAYAVYVHEDLSKNHPTGQAKFLEEPARRLRPEISKIVATNLVRGLTLEQSLLLGGLFLQRASQQRVPVDTGNLKNSAFTRAE